MMSYKMTGSIDQVLSAFKKQLTEEYELDEEFIGSLTEMLKTHITPVIEALEAEVKAASADGKKKRNRRTGVKRKKSAYNVFVREQMKSKALADVHHKEKMGKIAALWKGLTDKQKQKYTKLADKENVAAEAAATQEAEA